MPSPAVTPPLAFSTAMRAIIPSHIPAKGSTPCGVVMAVTEPIVIVVSVTPWVVFPDTSVGTGSVSFDATG